MSLSAKTAAGLAAAILLTAAVVYVPTLWEPDEHTGSAYWAKATQAAKRRRSALAERAAAMLRLTLALGAAPEAAPAAKAAAWRRYVERFGAKGEAGQRAQSRLAHWQQGPGPGPRPMAGAHPGLLTVPTGDTDRRGNPVLHAASARALGEVWLTAPRLELVPVPAGQFAMGSQAGDPDRQDNETPAHTVRIPAGFYMGKYEVTQQQYRVVMDRSPSRYPGDDAPVEQVSWTGAAAFCELLSEWTGLTIRLPTEAEWEYACRAGTASRYSCGDCPRYQSLRPSAVYGEDGPAPHPVGSKKPNPWGLYDMHGNVWEWCSDGLRTYSARGQVDPRGPAGGDRVVRGGAWSLHPRRARSAFRIAIEPEKPCHLVGFRVVCELRAAPR